MRVLALLLLATACAPKAHPLQGQRDALAAQDALGALEDWTPDAKLVVGGPLRDQLLTEGAAIAAAKAPEKIDVPVPVIGAVTVYPEIDDPTIALADSNACAACTEVTVRGTGKLKLDKTSAGMSWEAAARGTVELAVQPGDANAQRVVLVGRTSPPPLVDIRASGLPPLVGPALSTYAQMEARKALAESKPVDLFELPAGSPVRVRGIALDAARDLSVDIAVTALHRGAPTALPDAGDGWLLAVPADTLLGIVHKAAVEQDLVYGLAFEPRTLVFTDDGGFEIALRVWKAGRDPRASDFLIDGRLDLLPSGNLVLKVVGAREASATDRPIGRFYRNRILKTVSRLRQVFPVSREIVSGDVVIDFAATAIETRPDLLVVRGTVSLNGGGPGKPSAPSGRGRPR